MVLVLVLDVTFFAEGLDDLEGFPSEGLELSQPARYGRPRKAFSSAALRLAVPPRWRRQILRRIARPRSWDQRCREARRSDAARRRVGFMALDGPI